jgi:hypothetical protein
MEEKLIQHSRINHGGLCREDLYTVINMVLDIKKVEYFNIIVDGNAGEGYKLLSMFATLGISLLAFKAIPVDRSRTQFSLFPNDSSKMTEGAKKAGLIIEGPNTAILVKSNSDEPGECADIHKRLSHAGINVYESIGIADIKGSYGVILCIKQEDCEKAIAALKE